MGKWYELPTDIINNIFKYSTIMDVALLVMDTIKHLVASSNLHHRIDDVFGDFISSTILYEIFHSPHINFYYGHKNRLILNSTSSSFQLNKKIRDIRMFESYIAFISIIYGETIQELRISEYYFGKSRYHKYLGIITKYLKYTKIKKVNIFDPLTSEMITPIVIIEALSLCPSLQTIELPLERKINGVSKFQIIYTTKTNEFLVKLPSSYEKESKKIRYTGLHERDLSEGELLEHIQYLYDESTMYTRAENFFNSDKYSLFDEEFLELKEVVKPFPKRLFYSSNDENNTLRLTSFCEEKIYIRSKLQVIRDEFAGNNQQVNIVKYSAVTW